ncbi:ABC transporter permease [Kineosporia succinea]|uniref:Peptide/nickel transport system permease protein n=1 Tax=Kineosporia succinea TaxID=84632 RepID=A0ABT9PC75_9ACTN|nr:ABC transporter permease [Kineosporia succinea]MDP9830306.1 peptide/nickel transport system permease protein [Kineosporia succinea]
MNDSLTPATTVAPAGRAETPPVRTRRISLAGLRPLGRTVVNFLIFVLLAFFLVKLIPGDPVVVATGGRLSGEQLEAAREVYGLDGSWWQQLVDYLRQLATLDLGNSIATGRPISDELLVRIPSTLELVLTGLAASTVVALLLSHYVVTHRAAWLSKALTVYARSAGALPEYVVGIAFLFIFYAKLHWAPAPSGRLDPILLRPPATTNFPILDALLAGDTVAAASYVSHLVLPVLVMVFAHTPLLMKMLILSLDESIDDPATKFRVASGAPRSMVLASVYRRALPSMVATLGMLFGMFLGGAVVLEALFGLGGLGQYAVDAVNASDVFALRSFLLATAALCLLIYLLVDLAIMLLDPRRRAGVDRKDL